MTDYTWPSSLKPRQMNVIRDYREIPYTGVVSGSRNSIELSGSALRARVGLSLNEEEALELDGFLGQIRAQDRILMPDYRHPGNAYTAHTGRTIRVRGAVAAEARSIPTDGWPTSQLVMKPGDRFSIDNFLYICTGTVNRRSSAAGVANIPVFGPTPSSGVADNAELTFDDPVGSWLLLNKPETPSTVGGRIVTELQLLQDVKK